MLAYRYKQTLIHRLHPGTVMVFAVSVFVLSLTVSHPLYLLGLFLAVGAVILASEAGHEWVIYLKATVVMVLVIILINSVVGQLGSTPLLPTLPAAILRHFNPTLESVVYGIVMGLRLLVVVSVFCLYTYAVHPDSLLSMLGRGMAKSVLVVILATRLFPLLISDYCRISEVQRCRGVRLEGGRMWERIGKLIPIAGVLLYSSLERSLLVAESMYARGFGSGSRTLYRREEWGVRDKIVLGTVACASIIGVAEVALGLAQYQYYPVLGAVYWRDVVAASIMTALFCAPGVLAWGWEKWPWLRSRI